MSEWYQAEFWTDAQRKHFELLAPYIIEILFRGAVGGVEALPEQLRILMNWDSYNQAALDWLDRWRLGTLRGIDEHTRARSVKIISEWVRSGEPLPLLQKRLEYLFDKPRAKRIAVTEVTRMFAEGNLMAWRASNVVSGKRWMTAVDDRVCPICGPLQGKIVELSGAWTIENGQVVNGLGITAPPSHVNCRCYLQPIVDVDMAGREYARILREMTP